MEYNPEKASLLGVAFGSSVILAIASLFATLFTLFSIKGSHTQSLLLAGNILMIIHVLVKYTLIHFSIVQQTFLSSSLFSCLVFVANVFAVIRTRKLLSPLFYKSSIFVIALNSLVLVFYTPYSPIPLLVFGSCLLITSFFAYVFCFWCYFCIGKLIRSNPSSKHNKQQQRLERLSNAIVILGGGSQIICISLAFTQYNSFSVSFMALTLFFYSIAELLLELNKHTHVVCHDITGMSRFNLQIN